MKTYREGHIKFKICEDSRIGVTLDNELTKIKILKDGSIKRFLLNGKTKIDNTIKPVKLYVKGHEFYFTSYPYLIRDKVHENDTVHFLVRNNYASIKKEKIVSDMFVNGYFNLNLPAGYITLLGYYDLNN